MYRLVRITSSDYRDYRRAYSRIEYSFFKKGEEQPLVSKAVREMIQCTIKGKGEFLDEVEKSQNELYFFKVNEEIQGIVHLIFSQDTCNIYQFAVFEHGKGWGSTLYQNILEIIKEHKCKKITLWCPYDGAKIFWIKQGFHFRQRDFFEKRV